MSATTGAGGSRRVIVLVDGSGESATALLRGAAQARQRNALLDVVRIVPADADTRAMISARVWLGEFTRRQCPYGVGTQVRFRVERGDPEALLPLPGEGAELLLTGHPEPAADVPPPAARHHPWWLSPLYMTRAHDLVAFLSLDAWVKAGHTDSGADKQKERNHGDHDSHDQPKAGGDPG